MGSGIGSGLYITRYRSVTDDTGRFAAAGATFAVTTMLSASPGSAGVWVTLVTTGPGFTPTDRFGCPGVGARKLGVVATVPGRPASSSGEMRKSLFVVAFSPWI